MKELYVCLKEIGGNGSGNVLDFKINISYPIASKMASRRRIQRDTGSRMLFSVVFFCGKAKGTNSYDLK